MATPATKADKNSTMAAGSLSAISTPAIKGTTSSHGLMVNTRCSPSAKRADCEPPSVAWLRLTTRKMTRAMTKDGTVVMSI